jgi:hypothetical protein
MRSSWIGLALLAFTAKASAAQDFTTLAREWADTLAVDSRVVEEINRYAADQNHPFEHGYPAAFAAGVRRLVFTGLFQALGGARDEFIEPTVTVTYMEPGFARETGESVATDLEKGFEGSFIRTECHAFFECEGVSPAEALRTYTAPEFRKGVTSRIKRISFEDGEDCVETDGVKFLLAPTHYCSRIDELHDSSAAVQHSQVVSNRGENGYQSVYFKESLKTFVAARGGLLFHYVSYIRGGDLGGIQKKLAKGKIADSERRAVEEFKRLIDSKAPPVE